MTTDSHWCCDNKQLTRWLEDIGIWELVKVGRVVDAFDLDGNGSRPLSVGTTRDSFYKGTVPTSFFKCTATLSENASQDIMEVGK
jgi:hypothetical protein